MSIPSRVSSSYACTKCTTSTAIVCCPAHSLSAQTSKDHEPESERRRQTSGSDRSLSNQGILVERASPRRRLHPAVRTIWSAPAFAGLASPPSTSEPPWMKPYISADTPGTGSSAIRTR